MSTNENKARVINAAYKYSEELGKEVEALANNPTDRERLERVRELVNRQFGKEAGLVYETVVAALGVPG